MKRIKTKLQPASYEHTHSKKRLLSSSTIFQGYREKYLGSRGSLAIQDALANAHENPLNMHSKPVILIQPNNRTFNPVCYYKYFRIALVLEGREERMHGALFRIKQCINPCINETVLSDSYIRQGKRQNTIMSHFSYSLNKESCTLNTAHPILTYGSETQHIKEEHEKYQ